ncbi:MAG: VOC family protein [Thermomicrobiales bacterium]|nr:VOC family protein [Thermomicrobiales bacterium]
MQSVIPTLTVADIDASLKFYAEVLGFQPTFTMPGPDGRTVHGSMQRGDVALMFALPAADNPQDQPPYGRGVALYTTIADDEDVDALFRHARDKGARILYEPTDQFWGHRDWGMADPDGYVTIVSKVVKQVTEADIQKGAAAMTAATR